MKIAITQRELEYNGIIYDCLERGWHELFVGHTIITMPNLQHCSQTNFDMLVISGGNNSIDRFRTEFECYKVAWQSNLPIIGICHGAFFLNEIHGGVTGTIDGHQNSQHKIVMEGQEHLVNSYHNSKIDKLGEDLVPIATAESDVEGFKHVERPIWGLVWHPERMEEPVLPKMLQDLINE
jgi:N5-(cytidine 5'-diphosphoramidyl)-L-glutamine hydrolase